MHRTLLVGLAGLALAMAPALAQGPTTAKTSLAQQAPALPVLDASPVIAGHVSLSDGRPACGAQVFISWVSESGEAQLHKLSVDVRGDFDVSTRLTPRPNSDPIRVVAALPGQGLVWREAHISRFSNSLFDMKLLPSTTLTGRLIRLDGRPASNVTVSVAALMGTPALINAAMRYDSASAAPVNGAAVEPDEQRISSQQALQIDEHPPLSGAVRALFYAKTDSRGRFTLRGLPAGSKTALRIDSGLTLAAGSRGMIDLKSAGHFDAGLLVAVQPGRVKIHVQDRLTHEPARDVFATILSGDDMTVVSAVDQRLDPVRNFKELSNANNLKNGVVISEIDPAGRVDLSGFVTMTNRQGDLDLSPLLPGDYKINIAGRIVSAHVEEGRSPAPIQLALRHGALHVRLLDAGGKPLANVSVYTLIGAPHNLSAENNTLEERDQRALSGDRQFNKTAADGSFTFDTLPWGSPVFTIRAVKGNDLAEWTGSPDELGSTLVLQMRSNALITVSGRLIDPDRKPLTTERCETIHWLASPRSTWFATATQVSADANGYFRISGLERGESFSMVMTVQRAVVEGPGPSRSFESPRFTTLRNDPEQDLGEVMVHPVQTPAQTPDEISKFYNNIEPLQQAEMSDFLPAPTAAEAKAAQQVLAQYQKALKANDLDALHRLTSRLAPGWSADRRAFLQHCLLTTLTDAETLASDNIRALPLVPRSVAAKFLQSDEMDPRTGIADLNAIIRELDLNSNLVCLAEQTQTGVKLAGLLRKEDGVWRVVTIPLERAESGMDFLLTGRISAQDKVNFNRFAPTLEASAQAEAQTVATSYLKSWAQNRHDPMLPLTAPDSPLHAIDLATFEKRLTMRRDEGICPLIGEDSVVLQPLKNLTIWDQELLISRATLDQSMQPVPAPIFVSHTAIRGESSVLIDYVRRGDAAFFRYRSAGQDFLISLVRINGKWTVLEPAFPM